MFRICILLLLACVDYQCVGTHVDTDDLGALTMVLLSKPPSVSVPKVSARSTSAQMEYKIFGQTGYKIQPKEPIRKEPITERQRFKTTRGLGLKTAKTSKMLAPVEIDMYSGAMGLDPRNAATTVSDVDQFVGKIVTSPLFEFFIPSPWAQGIPINVPMNYQTEFADKCLPSSNDQYARPVPGDGEEEALLRPLLDRSQIQFQNLKRVYDSRSDGFSPKKWHERVDFQGPCIVVAKTEGGALCGGYAPKGFAGLGESRGAVNAFLFTWPDGDTSKRPQKIIYRDVYQKIFLNKPKDSIIDVADNGPQFGPDFTITMTEGKGKSLFGFGPGGSCTASSKVGDKFIGGFLGLGGVSSLFAEDEGDTAQITELRAYVAKWLPAEKDSSRIFVPFSYPLKFEKDPSEWFDKNPPK